MTDEWDEAYACGRRAERRACIAELRKLRQRIKLTSYGYQALDLINEMIRDNETKFIEKSKGR